MYVFFIFLIYFFWIRVSLLTLFSLSLVCAFCGVFFFSFFLFLIVLIFLSFSFFLIQYSKLCFLCNILNTRFLSNLYIYIYSIINSFFFKHHYRITFDFKCTPKHHREKIIHKICKLLFLIFYSQFNKHKNRTIHCSTISLYFSFIIPWYYLAIVNKNFDCFIF
jgi:hypothetical protein